MPPYLATLETRRSKAYAKIVQYLKNHHAIDIPIPTYNPTLRIFHYSSTTIAIDTHSTFVRIFDAETHTTYETPQHHTRLLITASHKITLEKVIEDITKVAPLSIRS